MAPYYASKDMQGFNVFSWQGFKSSGIQNLLLKNRPVFLNMIFPSPSKSISTSTLSPCPNPHPTISFLSYLTLEWWYVHPDDPIMQAPLAAQFILRQPQFLTNAGIHTPMQMVVDAKKIALESSLIISMPNVLCPSVNMLLRIAAGREGNDLKYVAYSKSWLNLTPECFVCQLNRKYSGSTYQCLCKCLRQAQQISSHQLCYLWSHFQIWKILLISSIMLWMLFQVQSTILYRYCPMYVIHMASFSISQILFNQMKVALFNLLPKYVVGTMQCCYNYLKCASILSEITQIPLTTLFQKCFSWSSRAYRMSRTVSATLDSPVTRVFFISLLKQAVILTHLWSL